jgi:hypothetical protein
MGGRCKVLAMSCAPNDEPYFIYAMKRLISANYIVFLMWKQYTGLVADKKQTIIDAQNNFNNSYRSITLAGFADYDKEVPMHIYTGPPDSKREPHHLEAITVSEYIKQHIISGDGTPLFWSVHPTTPSGVREFVMELHHFEEAKEWAERGFGELARVMNEYAISLVFTDPENALQESFNDPWVPYHRNKHIPLTPSRSRYKRARATTPARASRNEPETQSYTYASAISGNVSSITPNTAPKTPIRKDPPRIMRTNSMVEVIEIPDTPIPNSYVSTTLQNPPPIGSINSSSINSNHWDFDTIAQHIAKETEKIREQLSADLSKQLQEKTESTTNKIMEKFEKIELKMYEEKNEHQNDFQKMGADVAKILSMLHLGVKISGNTTDDQEMYDAQNKELQQKQSY